MIPVSSDMVLAVFIVFCRVGACLMLMPGFSSARIPVQVRLFLALAVTLALAPQLVSQLQAAIADLSEVQRLQLMVSELVVGVIIGLMGRIFYMALQFSAAAAAMFAGFTATPGTPVEDVEPLPAFGTLITLTATVLFFMADLHSEVIRALIGSYATLPVTDLADLQASLHRLSETLGNAFLLGLQVGSPFIVYAVIINLAFGIANKLIPQMPVYFISLPFVIGGGMILLYLTISESLRVFLKGFSSWLLGG